VIRVSHVAKELWFIGAATVAVFMLYVHFDTKMQMADALRDRDREERMEAKDVQNQLEASQRAQNARIDALEVELRAQKVEMEQINLKQKEVRKKLKLD
jgi:hypothetical protein